MDLDIAGTFMSSEEKGYKVKGATGTPVRMLVNLAMELGGRENKGGQIPMQAGHEGENGANKGPFLVEDRKSRRERKPAALASRNRNYLLRSWKAFDRYVVCHRKRIVHRLPYCELLGIHRNEIDEILIEGTIHTSFYSFVSDCPSKNDRAVNNVPQVLSCTDKGSDTTQKIQAADRHKPERQPGEPWRDHQQPSAAKPTKGNEGKEQCPN